MGIEKRKAKTIVVLKDGVFYFMEAVGPGYSEMLGIACAL
jgi:hypothetical protein